MWCAIYLFYALCEAINTGLNRFICEIVKRKMENFLKLFIVVSLLLWSERGIVAFQTNDLLPICTFGYFFNKNKQASCTGKIETKPESQLFSYSNKKISIPGASATAHDYVTYRSRSGEILSIPQAERYSSKDWLHNLRTLPYSGLLKRINSIVLINVLWSLVVFIVYRFAPFPCPGAKCHSLLGSALGLLLVFRTNTAYNRFWEGRKIWERILTNIRDMGRYSVLYADILGLQGIERIFHLLLAFPSVLQQHLQGFQPNGDLANLLYPDELRDLAIVENKPYYIVCKLSQAVRNIKECPSFTSRERQMMLNYIDRISYSIGASERIVQTPVPLTYVRHTSRFLSIFCFTAPIALVKELGLFVVPFSLIMTWALFGILEIGMVIEEPFQESLQLEVFTDTIRRDLSDLLHVTKVHPTSMDLHLQVFSPNLTQMEYGRTFQGTSNNTLIHI